MGVPAVSCSPPHHKVNMLSDAPSLTRSMHVALKDLRLDRLWVVYPGSTAYELHGKVSVIPLEAVADTLR